MYDTPLNSLNLDRTLATAGSPAASFARLWQSLWAQPYVSPALLEMCRLTLARLHQDEAELAAANPHVQPGALAAARRTLVVTGRTRGAAELSALEQAVLLFTECYALDAQSISDETADLVKTHLGEPGLVLLVEALGCIDGRIRTARCLRDFQRLAPAQDLHGS